MALRYENNEDGSEVERKMMTGGYKKSEDYNMKILIYEEPKRE